MQTQCITPLHTPEIDPSLEPSLFTVSSYSFHFSCPWFPSSFCSSACFIWWQWSWSWLILILLIPTPILMLHLMMITLFAIHIYFLMLHIVRGQIKPIEIIIGAIWEWISIVSNLLWQLHTLGECKTKGSSGGYVLGHQIGLIKTIQILTIHPWSVVSLLLECSYVLSGVDHLMRHLHSCWVYWSLGWSIGYEDSHYSFINSHIPIVLQDF